MAEQFPPAPALAMLWEIEHEIFVLKEMLVEIFPALPLRVRLQIERIEERLGGLEGEIGLEGSETFERLMGKLSDWL